MDRTLILEIDDMRKLNLIPFITEEKKQKEWNEVKE